jgi:hypothetical protein
MAASTIAHNQPRRDWVCYSESDEAAVENIRAKTHAANQQECSLFADSSQVAAVENALIIDSIRSWRETPVRLCYLAKDGGKVRKAVDRAIRKGHDG